MFQVFAAAASKAALSLLMSVATEEMFKDLFIWLAEKAAKSSKTKWDDELIAKIKENL